MPRNSGGRRGPRGPRVVDTILRNLLAYGVAVAALLAMADGTATVSLLNGQERDYYHGWRLSGTGTWKLIGREPAGWNYGQHVRLRLPDLYKWTFELRRDDRQTLELYFFYGDPDARSAYVLEKDP
ncbi:hypothetical protein ACFC1D_07090 [Streptomyces vinaceus]|uniref:hypothetical protein n=1 Tax=Streptomyces vinaceus TaxID=1960 RepID=UPI0035D6E676